MKKHIIAAACALSVLSVLADDGIYLVKGSSVIARYGITEVDYITFNPTDDLFNPWKPEDPTLESSALEMPKALNTIFILGDVSKHFDFGYPALMHIRDVVTGDMSVVESGYDWFSSWSTNSFQGENTAYSQLIWETYKEILSSANQAISFVDRADAENLSDRDSYFLGAALAWRAFTYLEMAQMYEFLPNDATSSITEDGNDVLNLTVPIVTENTTEEVSSNNPRATRQEMINFILQDLDDAELYIAKSERPNKTLPDLSVVYGLKARAYMWVENYTKAREYARKAINEFAGSPTTKEQWLSTTVGFNNLNTASWMWGGQYNLDDDAVTASIINWISFVCNETTFGYASAEPFVMIDANLYKSIADEDFRKYTFVAPKNSALEGKENYINKANLALNNIFIPEYGSLKIKPRDGHIDDSYLAPAVAYPLMRIEEMYFIEAEAAAHISDADGKQLIEDFMRTYRYTSYTCENINIVDEIFKQKRIEFFGEGQIFFDYKRLNKSVTRKYIGTNFASDRQFNTNGRPAWMNFVIVVTELNNNSALVGYNNPDPSDAYRSSETKSDVRKKDFRIKANINPNINAHNSIKKR